jgi:multiple sugar transport system ATP-binding protein
MAEIVLDSVVKRYPDGFEAVKDLNLDISDGEFMILVGPSGCGKSTALNMIAGLEDISGGELRIDGKVVNQIAPRDRDIAMVFQSYALYPHMTVRENMAFALNLKKTPKAEVNRKVQEAAEILDLTEHLERKPANLSGGQRQRVAMGRAIVRDPKAFLMDEPLSNLDAKLRVQMRAQVARIQRRFDTTTVYVTHDQTEAMTLGDRVAVMLSGVLQQVGTPIELYNNPANLFVAGFIGSPGMNFMPATLNNGSAHLPMADVTLPQEVRERLGRQPAGRRVIAGLRPEDFEDASRVDREDLPRGPTFNAKLDLVEAMGAEFYAHFGIKGKMVESEELLELRDDAGGVEELTDAGDHVLVARLSPQSRARTGGEAELWLDATKLHFFDEQSGDALTFAG